LRVFLRAAVAVCALRYRQKIGTKGILAMQAGLARHPRIVSGLGEIMQIAFIPRDLDKALRFWTETMGVGPFFQMKHSQQYLQDHLYRGRPCEADFSILLAYWGDLQVELIEQHNDAPSIYRDHLKSGHDGMHHVCILVDDLASAVATCERQGGVLMQGARSDENRFAYIDTGGGPGTMLEMLQPTPDVRAYQLHMKAAAASWDGSEPVRAFGT
jgi:methylmalonyl-CoA/ethylmalonyl-CoA epimerase